MKITFGNRIAVFAVVVVSLCALNSCAGFGLPGEKQVLKDMVGQKLVYAYDNQDWQSMLSGGSAVKFKEGEITKLSILKDKTSSNKKAGRLTYFVNIEADLSDDRIAGEVRIQYRKTDQGWKIDEIQSVDQENSFTSFSMIVRNENGIDPGM